jgi:hypothetical protein
LVRGAIHFVRKMEPSLLAYDLNAGSMVRISEYQRVPA